MTVGSRFRDVWSSRNALIALVLLLGSVLLAIALGDTGALFVAILALWLLPRRPRTSGVLEVGALSGLAFGASTSGPRILLALGATGLLILFVVRFVRGRGEVVDARVLGVMFGLLAVCTAHWLAVPRLTAASAWLLLCGWLSAVALGLFTEGFAKRPSAVGVASDEDSGPRSPGGVDSIRERVWGRGSVGRTALSAAIATGADFLVFHALLGVMLPGVATLVGAAVGGTVNFAINRRWAFDGHGSLTASAARYIWVSAASGVLNSAAVSLALLEPAVSPVGAWLVARILSFFGWSYPMQRDHVFSQRLPRGADRPI